ncbi:MAG TPA: 2-succinyl-5-enolpyruvyl-6-hydroxy-3-cyclohexene-1-carboxylic-acid synthase, partial [Flavobacteriales bacterium]|nr:2-succinyl-5-enolpyruvyl-6-hydroxy-3-cyclohexene-1-carboxylic-acid synthase [Flavobacteriales bacterium]
MVSSIKGVHELVELCKMHGITRVVVSPGSRNAPLSITLSNTNGIDTYVVVDERSAAFFALGISLALDQPVAVVCTSGSAALNYAPAVSEAYYQKIPLIVITADRPQEWINQADGQTIMQHEIYGKHILHSVTLPVIENNDSAWMYNRLINEAFLKANGNVKGPVHINVPFKEPLYNTVEAPAGKVRSIRVLKQKSILNAATRTLFEHVISDTDKALLLVGQGKSSEKMNKVLEVFTSFNQCVILSETTSNISCKGAITTIDRVIDGLTETEKKEFAPHVLITAGDAIVSKKVKAWLRSNRPFVHMHIGYEHNVVDTYSCLTDVVEANPVEIFEQGAAIAKNNARSTYAKMWAHRHEKIKSRQKEFMAGATWSDLKLFEILLKALPACNLHLGNSSPIRYVQLFDMNPHIHYYSNRGTSGIDGCSSTAAGFSVVSDKLNVLITGDISFY